jgi:hypothetical protein
MAMNVYNFIKKWLAGDVARRDDSDGLRADELPKLRLIQHLSCTGGTLFSKCLAAQPRSMVLSEIDPFAHLFHTDRYKPKFMPTDVLAMVSGWKEPFTEALVETLFLDSMQTIAERLTAENKTLVLRGHAHAAYLTGPEVRPSAKLTNVLKQKFQLYSAVSIRHPIDSYLSLMAQKWDHFTPNTFDEYCRRYVVFLEDHADSVWFKYEDLVESPESTIASLCKALEMDFDPSFAAEFFNYQLSGDSGRRGDVIAPRPRRELPAGFADEVESSASFRKLSNLTGYQDLNDGLSNT